MSLKTGRLRCFCTAFVTHRDLVLGTRLAMPEMAGAEAIPAKTFRCLTLEGIKVASCVSSSFLVWLQISLRSCLLCTYMIDKKCLIYLLDCLHQSLILHLEIYPEKFRSLFFLYIQNAHPVFLPLCVLRQQWQHFMEISKSFSSLQGLLAKNQKLRVADQC